MTTVGSGIPPPGFRYSDNINRPVTSQFIESLLCPSDERQRWEGFFGGEITKHNYAVNYGNTGIQNGPLAATLGAKPQVGTGVNATIFGGAPFFMSGWSDIPPITVRFAQITDGLSNTLMASEVIAGRGEDKRGYAWHGVAAGFTAYSPPNTSEPDVVENCGDPSENPPCTRLITADRPMRQSARSWHPGGVNALNCDSSIRFVSDDIFYDTWQALSTSHGEEIGGIY